MLYLNSYIISSLYCNIDSITKSNENIKYLLKYGADPNIIINKSFILHEIIIHLCYINKTIFENGLLIPIKIIFYSVYSLSK